MRKLSQFISSTLTRPADTTAYASGDLVGNNVTAGSVVAMTIAALKLKKGGGFSIKRVRIKKSSANITNAAFRVHFYSSPPAFSAGDNAAWLTTETGYLGSIDVTVDRAFSAGSIGVAGAAVNSEIAGVLTNARYIYAVLEARGAYTPTSAETFVITTWAELDKEE